MILLPERAASAMEIESPVKKHQVILDGEEPVSGKNCLGSLIFTFNAR